MSDCFITPICCCLRAEDREMNVAWGTVLLRPLDHLQINQPEGMTRYETSHGLLRSTSFVVISVSRHLSPLEREQVHPEEQRKRDVPMTPMMKALIQMEDTKATEGRPLAKTNCSGSSTSSDALHCFWPDLLSCVVIISFCWFQGWLEEDLRWLSWKRCRTGAELCWELRGVYLQRVSDLPHCPPEHRELFLSLHPVSDLWLTPAPLGMQFEYYFSVNFFVLLC